MLGPCAEHCIIYAREQARLYNVLHNISSGVHHSGPQVSLDPTSNRAYVTLSAYKTHPFRRGITPTTATGVDLGHIHAVLITHTVPRRLQTFSPTHPVPSVLGSLSLSPVPVPADGTLGIGACRPGRGRSRASLWGSLPRRVPPGAWSLMRPPL